MGSFLPNCMPERQTHPQVNRSDGFARKGGYYLPAVVDVKGTPRSSSPKPAVSNSRWGQRGCVQLIRDDHQLVWIRPLITISANRRGDSIDRGRAVSVHHTCDIAQTIPAWRPGKSGCRITTAWIIGDGVRNTQLQTRLQGVGQAPLSGLRVEDPLLQSGSRLGGGVGVYPIGEGIVAVTFVSNVQGVGIRKPDSEREGGLAL